MYVHHSAGLSLSIDTIGEQRNVMRAFWHLHVKEFGWDDVAYSFVVFPPHGRLTRAHIWVGRNFDRVPASQAGCNAGNWSACVHGNYERERPNPDVLEALRYLRRRARRRGYGAVVRGHRDCAGDTVCPGRHLYAALKRL